MGRHNFATKQKKVRRKNKEVIKETQACYWLNPSINYLPNYYKPRRRIHITKTMVKNIAWIALTIAVITFTILTIVCHEGTTLAS